MSEPYLKFIESVIAALIGAVATYYFTNKIEKKKIQEARNTVKYENLIGVYKNLIKILNNFPMEAPVDILNRIEFPPNYSHENYKAVINSLNYQIRDDLKDEDKNQIDIANRRYCIKELTSNENQYLIAKDMYESFNKNEKAIIDLYASVEVKNTLVELDTLIYNAFVAGNTGFLREDFTNMKKELSMKLISEMRNDLGADFI